MSQSQPVNPMPEPEILIEGRLVLLRDRGAADLEAFTRWQGHGEWREWDAPWEHGEPFSAEKEKAFRDRYHKSLQFEQTHPRYASTIALPDGTPLGWVNRYQPKKSGGPWCVGIDICEDAYVERGMGTEALQLWVSYLFRYPEFHRIGLETWSFNQRMIRVAEKVGFVHEGTVREAREWNGARIDMVTYGILRREWVDTWV